MYEDGGRIEDSCSWAAELRLAEKAERLGVSAETSDPRVHWMHPVALSNASSHGDDVTHSEAPGASLCLLAIGTSRCTRTGTRFLSVRPLVSAEAAPLSNYSHLQRPPYSQSIRVRLGLGAKCWPPQNTFAPVGECTRTASPLGRRSSPTISYRYSSPSSSHPILSLLAS